MHMLKYIVVIFFLAVVFPDKVSAQSKCQDSISYQTINLGNGKESIPFPLTFQFTKDTLDVFTSSISGVRLKNFIKFKIVRKTCNWVSDYTEGKSEYDLILVNHISLMEAKLTIIVGNGKGEITLNYTDSNEPRVFEIKL
jgi:hypothetical protein